MRIRSTPESAQAGEVTLLAILELLIAMSVSLYIVVKYGTLTHIAIGSSIGFLLLLRTQASMRLGLSWIESMVYLFNAVANAFGELFPRGSSLPILVIQSALFMVFAALLVVPIGVAGIAVRTGSTILALVRHPLQSIREIPYNWFRQVLATDITHPPEFLPGIETIESSLGVWKWMSVLRDWRRSGIDAIIPRWNRLAFHIVYLLILVCFFAPSLVYRMSLKATTLIYLPFVWIIGKRTEGKSDLGSILTDIKESELERLKRRWAWIVIVFLNVIPICLLFFAQRLIHFNSNEEIITYFIPISEISSWHIARFLNAVITLLMFHYADRVSRRMKKNDTPLNGAVATVLAIGSLIRRILTLWTIGCGLYIVHTAVDWSTLPVVKWLPF